MSFPVRPIAAAVAAVLLVTSLTGCGTMTGIPSHGGGKRFAVEQRLVAASVRSTLMQIDVSPLKGKKVAIMFEMMQDEGGGTLNGGRINLITALTAGYVQSPVQSTNNQFQVFNLNETASNWQEQGSSSHSVQSSSSKVDSSGSGTANNTTNNGAVTTTTSGTTNSTTNNPAVTTTINNGAVTTTTNNPAVTTTTTYTPGTVTTTTGGTTTTQTSTPDTSTQTTAANTVTQTTGATTGTQTTGANTVTGSATTNGTQTTAANTSTTNGNSTSQGTQNGTGTTVTDSTAGTSTIGGSSANKQTVSPTPVSSQVQTKGQDRRASITMSHQGLGEYQNLSVPKSDSTYLIGMVRNYLILNGVQPVNPESVKPDALLYVMVDIFGTVRSRFDIYAYNSEDLTAETAIEMFATDLTGKVIMSPRSSNKEAKYKENYLLWAGPFKTDEEVRDGKGTLVNFSAVDGSKPTYESNTQRWRWEGNSQ